MPRLLFCLTLGVVAAGCSDRRRDPSSDAGALDAGALECTPGYACPAGASMRVEDGVGHCTWDGLTLPAGAMAYCFYFDDGYFGFYWDLAGADPSYTCPPGTRYAPNDEGDGYCLWEDLELPPGARTECDALLTERSIGFSWPCSP